MIGESRDRLAVERYLDIMQKLDDLDILKNAGYDDNQVENYLVFLGASAYSEQLELLQEDYREALQFIAKRDRPFRFIYFFAKNNDQSPNAGEMRSEAETFAQAGNPSISLYNHRRQS